MLTPGRHGSGRSALCLPVELHAACGFRAHQKLYSQYERLFVLHAAGLRIHPLRCRIQHVARRAQPLPPLAPLSRCGAESGPLPHCQPTGGVWWLPRYQRRRIPASPADGSPTYPADGARDAGRLRPDQRGIAPARPQGHAGCEACWFETRNYRHHCITGTTNCVIHAAPTHHDIRHCPATSASRLPDDAAAPPPPNRDNRMVAGTACSRGHSDLGYP